MLSATRELYLRKLNTVTYQNSLVEHYNLNKRSRKTEAGNKEWTIKRHWQHWIHKIQNGDKQRKKDNSDNKKDEQH